MVEETLARLSNRQLLPVGILMRVKGEKTASRWKISRDAELAVLTGYSSTS
jgi:hypothetical protein